MDESNPLLINEPRVSIDIFEEDASSNNGLHRSDSSELVRRNSLENKGHKWEHVGSGSIRNYDDIFDTFKDKLDIGEDEELIDASELFWENVDKNHKVLGQFRATAIAGNDITSSCLYVVGLTAAVSGLLSPISILLVCILLFMFRGVYAEVGSALPLNGGAYNALLNTTSKQIAALAACLTILSYIATSVVSASEASGYLYRIFYSDDKQFFWFTLIILLFFTFLNLIGITESAGVALLIFTIHLLTLAAVIIASFIYCVMNTDVIVDNYKNIKPVNGNYLLDIFYGFSTALLGVSGFESSANYIEEQKPGVFPKTLRNMWIVVAIVNPLLSVLCFGVLDFDTIIANQSTVLVSMANVAVGDWFGIVVAVDAGLVLSGAVLTSFVGVTGLLKRMSLDRILPQFFLRTNSFRKTNHWIIISFFIVTSSLYCLVKGDVNTLSSMYSIAFLCVMMLFALSNIMLKYKRDECPRVVKAHWLTVILALSGVILGTLGNIILNFDILGYFTLYFFLVSVGVLFMLSRVFVMKFVIYSIRKTPLYKLLGDKFENYARTFKDQKMIFFAKKPNPSTINKAILYIRDNEQTSNISIIHLYEEENDDDKIEFQIIVQLLDKMYPKMSIGLVFVKGAFNPSYVRRLSYTLDVPPNFMFIVCPDSKLSSSLEDFGGIRLITSG
eukprot:TRINITY_DN7987_c1_g2_i1.p1 TRINITY_DN7987_c1_g2~~TRINITY_DN7987_c1_g2_i1.p1  ORF type:complete len:672 (+),score=192.22 TRINITY_DN7987_c1_g2_i1:37-2052(+)